MADASIWLTLLVAALGTYFWRLLGVLVGRRIDPNGPLFEWVGCVAYALLAGLTMRMILLPIGALQATDLGCRLLAIGVAVAALKASGGKIAIGVGTGVAALIALTAAGVTLWG